MNNPELSKGNNNSHDDGSFSGWDELTANADNFNPVAAEMNRANDGEKRELASTNQYEKEILALGDRFEKPTFFLFCVEYGTAETREKINDFLIRQEMVEREVESIIKQNIPPSHCLFSQKF